MDKREAIEKLEAMLNRYDFYHTDCNEFTEDDYADICEILKWVESVEERKTGH